jgi:hypothetical protein
MGFMGKVMNYRDFQKTELFKKAGIVICLKKGAEILPRPLDHVIAAYPVKHPEYPHIPTICIEIF